MSFKNIILTFMTVSSIIYVFASIVLILNDRVTKNILDKTFKVVKCTVIINTVVVSFMFNIIFGWKEKIMMVRNGGNIKLHQ